MASKSPRNHVEEPPDAPEPAARETELDPPREPEPPEAVRTIADEQRERSEEIQRIGVEAFKAKFDTRELEEKAGKPVAGVSHRPVDKAEIEGSRR